METKKVELKYELEEDIPLSFGHKLRGYFANEFEHVLFHHHKDDGKLRYQYPLIQYKIIDNDPVVIALGKGCKVVTENFLDIKKLNLNGKIYEHPTGKLQVMTSELKVIDDYEMFPYRYEFISPWVALNQRNYQKYTNKLDEGKEKTKFLAKILTGNILSFAKGIGWWIEDKIAVMPDLQELTVTFKGNQMLAFKGVFYANICLPELIGLGKFVSRGFGTIMKKDIE